ncbi:MAG: ferredoxin family protein [Nitrospirae bacterium]|nr:ferredoxin family protein [Magnetococcales bacterium]HAT50524.1 hypothetical protein [Alphaproteobacteria bacterium]
MSFVTVDIDHCRGCARCIKVCKVEVLEQVDRKSPRPGRSHPHPRVVRIDDCYECMNCEDKCPANSIQVHDLGSRQVAFHQLPVAQNLWATDVHVRALVPKIPADSWKNAYKDLRAMLPYFSTALSALSNLSFSTGLQAGHIVAEKLPGIRRISDPKEKVAALADYFEHSFQFSCQEQESDPDHFRLQFHPCAMVSELTNIRQEPGDSTPLCQLVHGFISGLFTEFLDQEYDLHLLSHSPTGCVAEMRPVGGLELQTWK